jgi:hypothetical protein
MRHCNSMGITNERGGALSYALLVFMMLSIAVAVVVGYLSFSKTNEHKDALERKASLLAVGGMESFLAYLREYQPSMNVSPTEYVNRFANGQSQAFKWGNGDTDGMSFQTPEGQNVRLRFTQQTGAKDANGLYKMAIACRAVVDGNAVSEIKYVFSTMDTVPSSSGGTGGGGGGTGPAPITSVSTDPDNRICIEEDTNTIIIQGELKGNHINAEEQNPSTAGDTTVKDAVHSAITTYVGMIKEDVDAILSRIVATQSANPQPAASAWLYCTSCDQNKQNEYPQRIAETIAASSNNPVVLKLPDNMTLNSATPIEWGSTSKSVVLIANNVKFASKVKIYGDFYTSGVTFQSGANVEVTDYWRSSSAPSFESTNASMRAKNSRIDQGMSVKGTFIADEDLYVNGTLAVEDWARLTVGNLYATGGLTVRDSATTEISASGTVHAGGVMDLGAVKRFEAQHLIGYNIIELKGGTFDIAGRLYAGPLNATDPAQDMLRFNNRPTLEAGFILVNGQLRSNGQGSIIAVTGGTVGGEKLSGDLIARAMDLNGTSQKIDIPEGDFLVQTKVEANGGVDLDAGGQIALGAASSFNGSSVEITNGGKTSSLFLKGISNPCAAPGTPPFSFDPKRSD